MTLDPDSDRDILCVAGGTGLAPLKALVEEATERDLRRDIHLLFGVRTPDDLYDLPDLHALEADSPWVRVVPVVSRDPSFDGMHGQVPDVLDRFHDWSGHDVYVAGPAEMVQRTVTTLDDLGVPADHIHYDRLVP
jgi:NAD(P)H-flavin reductase